MRRRRSEEVCSGADLRDHVISGDPRLDDTGPGRDGSVTATATKAAQAPATAEHAWREVQEGRRGSGGVIPGSCANEAPGARQVTLGG